MHCLYCWPCCLTDCLWNWTPHLNWLRRQRHCWNCCQWQHHRSCMQPARPAPPPATYRFSHHAVTTYQPLRKAVPFTIFTVHIYGTETGMQSCRARQTACLNNQIVHPSAHQQRMVMRENWRFHEGTLVTRRMCHAWKLPSAGRSGNGVVEKKQRPGTVLLLFSARHCKFRYTPPQHSP